MTDRAGWAVCLTGPLGRGLGCDLELVEPRSELFVHDYMTETETAFVLAEPAGPARDLAANLIWSTKESALKELRTGCAETLAPWKSPSAAALSTGGGN